MNNTPSSEFLINLNKWVNDIKSIDNKVEWSAVEPDWWVDMMILQRKMYEIIRKHNGTLPSKHKLI